MTRETETLRSKVTAALQILGIRNFLLGIHDAAFPGLQGEDIGHGSPYSDGAADFLLFLSELGFNGIQLGPQGITTLANPSPYDGTFFSKNPLLLAPLSLSDSRWRLLDPLKLADLSSQSPPDRSRVHMAFATNALQSITADVCEHYRRGLLEKKHVGIARSYSNFWKRNSAWLERDALYEILLQIHGKQTWTQWQGNEEARLDKQLYAPQPGNAESARKRIEFLFQKHKDAIEDYCFTQYLIAEQHKVLQKRCRQLNLNLFGDCQIGMSDRDAWSAQSFLLADYKLGAPPSRTNPTGQAWNYPVLDPCQYYQAVVEGPRQPGAVIRFLRARIDKLFTEFDGLRIDHPHGLICPWVYRNDQQDPLRAVRNGARLFASPALADHPELARFAIARPDQLNPQRARFDDEWVDRLDPDQIRRYAILFNQIVESAGQQRHGSRQIACEILSTQPYPIKHVMHYYHQGRFRVTQKADLGNTGDVYRSENAQPEDWLMMGNHDTPTIWRVAKGWLATGAAQKQADYLATRLRIPATERTAWVERVSANEVLLVQASFADLLIGPAKNVMIYFTDLFGMHQTYNGPGSVNDTNWSLRVDADYQNLYRAGSKQNRALNIPKAIAMALRAQGEACVVKHRDLISDLESSNLS
ncbi:MAG: 4-alpha-glucanotransferase [Desulfuromonadales bacterium]|nr:4-alpha-glucanotransferase [Desulfuromonadales bacterium]